MRKMHKNQISEQVLTLREACAELQKLSGQRFVNLCAEIQDFVSSIHDFVETVASEETKTAEFLSEFYAMLFKAAQGEVSAKKLVKFVRKIEASVYELRVSKIEIAFFCYKASMSDSLASIYFAAKEDAACDAYFIPIPYFDRTAGGGLGKMHLEAEGFYSDLFELTDYRTYKVEEHLPDIAFIMNPYDQNNYVTTVHPDFYSSRLKQYCGLLCFSPYFVFEENADFIKGGKEWLCATAGTRNSDYIFVQSERVRDAWIAALHKAECDGNNSGAFGNLKKKIVALGSPKFDAVLNARREDCPLPKEWVHRIANKQVIFYNTTVSGILNGGKKYLQKVRHVIEAFRQRDDVLLWWRPHPLSEETLASMRQGLLEEYREIVSACETADEPSFIYDNSPDLHRAIVWGNAYYGDGSSVLQLFRPTGKPIVIQDISRLKEKRFELLQIYNLHQADGFLWFTCIAFYGLFRMDVQTQKVEYVGAFPNEPVFPFSNPYDGVVECNRALYFAPFACRNIGVFYLDDNRFDSIDLSAYTQNAKGKVLFCKILAMGENLVFVPREYPLLLIYNTKSKTVTNCSNVLKSLEPRTPVRIFQGAVEWMFCDACSIGSKVFMPYNMSNQILILDVLSLEYEVRQVGRVMDSFGCIEYDGTDFWMPTLNADGGLYRWNYKTNECAFFEYPSKLYNDFNLGVWHTAVFEDSMYILSVYEGFAWRFSFTTHTFEVDEVLQEACDIVFDPTVHYGAENYFRPMVVDGVMYVQAVKTNKLIRYPLHTKHAEFYDVACEDSSQFKLDIMSAIHTMEGAYGENQMRLEDLIEFLPAMSGQAGPHAEANEGKKGEAGNRIYEFVCKEAGLE